MDDKHFGYLMVVLIWVWAIMMTIAKIQHSGIHDYSLIAAVAGITIAIGAVRSYDRLRGGLA